MSKILEISERNNKVYIVYDIQLNMTTENYRRKNVSRDW
jgi:hypothetical protein